MLQKPQQGVDLAFGTGGLNGQRFRIHVHHTHAEQAHDLQHVGTVGFVGGHLDEHQFAFHGGVRVEFHDFEHMQQLVELLDDLLQRHGLHVGGHRDARDVRAFGGGDGQRVDVECAAGEQAGDTRQHAWAVLHQHGQRMTLGTRLGCRIVSHECSPLLSARSQWQRRSRARTRRSHARPDWFPEPGCRQPAA